MPIISVIVVTWNNEQFIEQALASCIDPDFTDYEVIVVHNASTDDTGRLIQRAIAGNKALFKVIENERNEGSGGARNIGMRHASGDYLMFLDGDDWYEPGAIARVAALIEEQAPDVLLFNHQRAYDTGYKKPNQLSYLLGERDISQPVDRAPVLMNFCVPWNKAYRRAFVEVNEFTFPHGYYEDVAWSYANLFKADSCYVVPDIVVNHRQHDGSITKTTDDRHFDLIEQYRKVVALLSQDSRYTEWYGAAAHEHGRRQLLNVLNVRYRLPSSKQSEYLRQAGRLLEQWQHLIGLNTRDFTVTVAKTGSPFLYFMGKRVLAAKRNLYRSLWLGKRQCGHLFYRQVLCRLPLNKRRVFFESYWGTKIDCNPLAIADGLSASGGYDLVFGVSKNAEIPGDCAYKTVRRGTLAYYFHIATSAYLVSNANFLTGVVKRAGSIHVQTLHGTPIKVMGIDIRPYNPDEMNWEEFRYRSQRWDYVISSNPHSSAAWRSGMPYDYRMIEIGYPRNDIFFNATAEKAAEIKEAIGIPADKKTALYAPTLRDKDRNQLFCPDMALGNIKSALGDDYVLLVRAHYLTQGKQDKVDDGIIDVSDYPITNEVCLVSDLLITDYSSVMFDYACLKRPIVLFPYDYDEYTRHRGVYMDIRQYAPGAVAETPGELTEVLAHRTFDSDENRARLRQFNAQFCPWDDGRATDRVLEEVFGLKRQTVPGSSAAAIVG